MKKGVKFPMHESSRSPEGHTEEVLNSAVHRSGKILSVGIDIGGTFTDFVAINDRTGSIFTGKCLSTPGDPSVGLFEGLDDLLNRLSLSAESVGRIIHGTTIAANAVIERKGAKTAYLTTRGFRDVVHMRTEARYDMYDLHFRFSEPLVPRHLCVELAERTCFDGDILTPADPDEIRAIVDDLIRKHSIESLAVCFLHSYVNPAHELLVEQIVQSDFGLHVSISSRLLPVIKEYERATTTIVDAYIKPTVQNYLSKLEEGLAERGFSGKLYIMTCSGGLVETDIARAYPVRLLESGPAAGVIIAGYIGEESDLAKVLSFDMGGTTAKGCYVVDRMAERTEDFEVARVYRTTAGSGIPIKSPSLKLIEIGGGGGSIVQVNERGLIQVGPESAGADPGPACYGLGGENPTVTDANLLLGYLNPDYFLGGKLHLSRQNSVKVFEDCVCEAIGIKLTDAAWGTYEVVNENMASAFRLHAAERGIDYRGFVLITLGGCGPIHAQRVARKLGITTVLFPPRAGVLSALGLLVTPLSFEFAKSAVSTLEELGDSEYEKVFKTLIDQGTEILQRAGLSADSIHVVRRLDMRYAGQGWEIELALPPFRDYGSAMKSEFTELRDLFEDKYSHLYSLKLPGTPIEIVNFKVTVQGPLPRVNLKPLELSKTQGLVKSRRPVFFEKYGNYRDCPVYDRYALSPGLEIEGPAVIEEVESTCIIEPDSRARVDDFLNVVVEME